ncbi:MAG: hypothetical protein ACYCT2_04005 [Thermoplasmataceae archaeon]
MPEARAWLAWKPLFPASAEIPIIIPKTRDRAEQNIPIYTIRGGPVAFLFGIPVDNVCVSVVIHPNR